ncbi:MAG: hypothetical protein WED87_06180 [Dehalococcoidia bacterium]
MPPFATGVFFLPSIGTRAQMVAGMAGRDPALYQQMLADIRELAVVADDLGYDAIAFTHEGYLLGRDQSVLRPVGRSSCAAHFSLG